jgi:hypothetical protein
MLATRNGNKWKTGAKRHAADGSIAPAARNATAPLARGRGTASRGLPQHPRLSPGQPPRGQVRMARTSSSRAGGWRNATATTTA